MAVAGLMFCTLYALTRRLGVPMGLHLDWSFAQGYIFGAAVSGNDLGGSIAVSTARPGAEARLTGGNPRPGSLSICPTTFNQLGDGRRAGAGPEGRPLRWPTPSVPVGCEPALLTALLIGPGCSPRRFRL